MFENNKGDSGDDVVEHHGKAAGSTSAVSDYERIQVLITKCATKAGHNVNFFEHSKHNGTLFVQPIYECEGGFRGPDQNKIDRFFCLLEGKLSDSDFNFSQNKIVNSRVNMDSQDLLCIILQLVASE